MANEQDENGVYNSTKPGSPDQDDMPPLKSPLRYERKVVLVTGGSKGIGQGIVRAFVGAGSNVVFCARGGT
jgi:3-oxoacyl-ACP reductase-like protein